MTTPRPDAPEWTDIPVELLKLLATSSMPHIAKERVELYVREREAAARADAERELAVLREALPESPWMLDEGYECYACGARSDIEKRHHPDCKWVVATQKDPR